MTDTPSNISIQVTGDTEEDLILGLKAIITTYQSNQNVYPTTSDNGQRLTLLVEINTDNAAFSELPYDLENDWEVIRNTPSDVALVTETCRILEKLASELYIGTNFSLVDINGNRVGSAEIKEVEEFND